MNYLSAENISKSYGEKALFENLTMGISQGDRVALIGINGSGKSTLLRLLAGIDVPDTGTISIRKGLTIGFLGQNPIFDEEASVFENVFNTNHPLMQMIREYELHLQGDKSAAGYTAKMDDLVEKMTTMHAWEYENRIKEIISRMGIGELIQKKVAYLSGGQRKRVAMAKVLMQEPDFLIMDEPTNHLDMETVEWLEELILQRFPTLLIVTHDRYFLDAVTNQIMELDRGEVGKYKGNYTYYLEKKEERNLVRNAEIEKSRNLMRRELEWIRRQPKARGTKAKYRVDAFEDLKQKAARPTADASLELNVKANRQGGKIVNLKNLTKSYDEYPLIKSFSHNFQKGERIGMVGKNGMGKTTFLKVLAGEIPHDSGDRDEGETTVWGYYKQEENDLDPEKRIIEVVKDIAEVIELADGSKISASQFLQMFLFPPSQQYSYVSTLSGGERKRLQLLRVLIKNPNFLILDEPTNDLDIGTLNILEEFLENYQGTLVLVSHDRYFMDKLVDHLFVFEGKGEIRDFPGNYTDYREWRKALNDKQKEEEKKVVAKQEALIPKKEVAKKKRTFKEQKEYEQLTEDIDKLEAEKIQLTDVLHQSAADYAEILKATNRLQIIENEIDEKSLRWLDLSELEGYG